MDKNKCDIIFENGLENNFPLLQLIENNKKNGKFTGKNSSSKINKQRTFSREFKYKIGMVNLFNSIKNKNTNKELDFKLNEEEKRIFISNKRILH